MNKLYLKNLQQRAQKLLQVSSDEEEQSSNFNLTKAKSRRVDLNQVLSNTDLNENQINRQFQDYRNTDVQLLKRCISLTNQNTQLKSQIKNIKSQKSQLQAQNHYLSKQLQNFKFQLTKIKERQSRMITEREETPKPNDLSNKHSLSNQRSYQNLKQKSQSMYKMSSKKTLQESNNDRTKEKQVQKWQSLQKQFKNQIFQLEQRLKVSNLKKQNLQQTILKQKQKSHKLWRFINTQIPALKQIILTLTNKVDNRVQKILLKDINDQQNETKNFNKRFQKVY